MTDLLREEFDAFFSEEGGIAPADFIDTFPSGPLINRARELAQAEANSVSAGLATKGVNHTVYFDIIRSPEMNAVAATPRPGVSFVGINLGTLLRARILLEVLLSQMHSPQHPIVDAKTLLTLIGQDAPFDDQWSFLREADARSFIVADAFPPFFVLVQWAFAFDFIYSHEMLHAMLSHTEYAARHLRLDRMHEGKVLSDDQGQRKLRLLELRADYGSGKMLGNRIPNKRFLIFPAPSAELLTVEELMTHAASAVTAIMSGFNIAWEARPEQKLYTPGSHPHPEFRFRSFSDGVMSGLRNFPESGYADTWFNQSGYSGNSLCKMAYRKILGGEYEFALQAGPVFYIPKEGAPGPHPHMFSTDAETMYKKDFEAMQMIDEETGVKAYLE